MNGRWAKAYQEKKKSIIKSFKASNTKIPNMKIKAITPID